MARVLTEDDQVNENTSVILTTPTKKSDKETRPHITRDLPHQLRQVDTVNSHTPNVERYVLVATLADQRHTNLACATLESNGVPIMVEHLRVRAQSVTGTAFRILAPLSSVQKALGILTRLGLAHVENEADEDAAMFVNA
jgi:hypothetical protein